MIPAVFALGLLCAGVPGCPVPVEHGAAALSVTVNSAARIATPLFAKHPVHEAARPVASPDPYRRSGRSRSGLPRIAHDPWFGPDKLRHLLASFAVTGWAQAGLRLLDAGPDAAVAGGAAISLAAGLGKELHDVRSGGALSLKDLAWDLAGIGLAAALLGAAR